MIIFTKAILGGQFVGEIIYPCTSLFKDQKSFGVHLNGKVITYQPKQPLEDPTSHPFNACATTLSSPLPTLYLFILYGSGGVGKWSRDVDVVNIYYTNVTYASLYFSATPQLMHDSLSLFE